MNVDAPTSVLGGSGEACATCGSALADDQRYCLSCGTRRAGPRVPVDAAAAVWVEPAGPPPPAPGCGASAAERLGGTWGVAALLLVALGVGVVIGGLGDGDAPAAARPPVVTIAAGALTTGATGATAAPVADATPAADEWPDKRGFTVQLGELAAGTTQADADAAKAAATAKGASAPGVLDPGAHGLTGGKIVLYSGVYSTRKAAKAALASLSSAYPDARVIAVKAAGSASGDDATANDSSSAVKPAAVSKDKLKATEKLAPDDFQKQSKKLPKTTALPGKAPPKDNAAPGGGSSAESIG